MAGDYYRPPDEGEPIDKVFLIQLQEASCSQALVLLGDFNHLNNCWKSSTASCRQSRRLLECTEDKFLSQVIGSPTRGNVIMDLMVMIASELIGEIRIGSSVGCSDQALVEFAVRRDMGHTKSRVRTLNFRRPKFHLLKKLDMTTWETALRDKGAMQICQLFKDVFLRAQELSIPMCKKLGKEGRSLSWLSKDLLVKLKCKQEMHVQWNRGHAHWEEHKDTVYQVRDQEN